MIFELKPLQKEDILTLLYRAVSDKERGMGAYNAVLEEDAAEFLADIAGGDARSALNAVELGILTTTPSADGKIHITVEVASECIQKRVVRYDKSGDSHYDTISAFIKSMRGSDPDAAVYYLARMLYAGEDVKFIAPHYDLCIGGCGKCRSPGIAGGSSSGTGGGTHRNAGIAADSFAGSALRGDGTEEQFRDKCDL